MEKYNADLADYQAEVGRLKNEYSVETLRRSRDYNDKVSKARQEFLLQKEQELKELASKRTYIDIRKDMIEKVDGELYLVTNLKRFKLSEYGISDTDR